MAVIEIARIQVRRGQELQTGIPQLDAGEFGWAQDTEHLYIGKRIAEGAPDDTNTRILTENDLNNVFAIIGSISTTTTLNSLYTYRQNIKEENLRYVTTSTLQTKLDTLVSLTDFGVLPQSGTTVDITLELRGAVSDLFANETVDWYSDQQKDFRRQLLIPAGNFSVSGTVDLPPYATIIGAGPELTKITFINSTDTLFRTIDADGNGFEDPIDMRSGPGRAREVHLEGMTLEFDNTLPAAKSLISLDNVLNARIENITFRTEISSTSTTTFGLVDHGVGIEIRGSGDQGSELCQNILIDHCQFDSLLTAVHGTGTVVRPVINHSVFSNLNQGIVMESLDTLQGPSNGYFSYNRFNDILQEAIYVGENPIVNGVRPRSNHLSTQNHYSRVGGTFFNEFTTTIAKSVLTFMSAGNKSVDDYFARRDYAERNTNPTFFYNPLVNGTVTINDSATYTKTVSTGSVVSVMHVPLNDTDQIATVNYQLTHGGLSRKGVIKMNIAPDGFVALTDTYNYSESLIPVLDNLVAAAGSGPNLLVIKTTVGSTDDTSLAKTKSGLWYFTGTINEYKGYSAYVTEMTVKPDPAVVDGLIYTFVTDSSYPTFDFSKGGTYSLLTSEQPELTFGYSINNIPNNYVSLTCSNGSPNIEVTLDYQVDIQT